MQAQTPSGPNPLFSLQRPADCNLPDLFQTLELITSLVSQKRGEITMRGNMGSLESGRSTRHPSRNKADSLKERLLNLGPSTWCRTQQNTLPPHCSPGAWHTGSTQVTESMEGKTPIMHCHRKMHCKWCLLGTLLISPNFDIGISIFRKQWILDDVKE